MASHYSVRHDERKRRQADHKNSGNLVLQNVMLDEDLREGPARLDWFIGRDPNDPEDVRAALLHGLREDVLASRVKK
jgi:hypothetical protein